jgi:ABC-2 type transport system permease protein
VTAPLSAPRATWLLARLRLLRLLNLLNSSASQAVKLGKSRAASAGKRRGGWALGVVLALLMCFSFGGIAGESVLNLYCALDPASVCHLDPAARGDARAMAQAGFDLAGAPFAPALANALAMQLWLLFLIGVLVPLSTYDLTRPDGDLEWLVTLPVPRHTLLWGRLLERALVNPSGWLALAPAALMIAWHSGQRWSAAPLAVAGVLALLLLAALLRTLADTGLRLLLAPSQLRNLQALCSIASLLPMYLAVSLGTRTGGTLGIELAAAFPAWTGWTPPGLVVQLLNAHDAGTALATATLLALQVATLLWLGVRLLRHLLRDGVVASGARERARRPVAAGAIAATAPRWRIGSAVQRRELTLLGRDRNFLVQSLLLPVLMVLAQLFISGRLDSVATLGENPAAMAAMAFGIGAYVLLAAFQSVNNEGQALWLLYTFPASVDTVLKEKAQLWTALTLPYPLAVFGLGLYFSAAPDWELLALLLVVLAGMPLYALIATSLGVLAANPLAQEAQPKLRPTYFYLYALLAALYGGAVAAAAWPQKIVFVVLAAALALALWQKARDALPYLLDPAAAPPARVSSADGLIAAMLFFLLQAAMLAVIGAGGEPAGAAATAIVFAVAGALSYALTRYSYWRTKTEGVPKVFARAPAAPLLAWGLGAGAGAAAFACAYVFLLRQAGVLSDATTLAGGMPHSRAWLLGLAVLAAPLFEEFIFRGLLFKGLRRSMRLPPAMLASAAVFAIVHPPQSMLPVFVLGLCSAYAYERGKSLLAPMLAHAGYNAALLGYLMFA